MKNFQRSGGGGRSFGKKDFGKRSFDHRDSARPLHKATCSECGNTCEVPFKPTNDRPVYCNNCFKREDKGGNSRRSDDRGYGDRDQDFGRNAGRSSMFEATCDECGNTCEIPFKPNGSKPVYCHDCFKKDGGGNRNNAGNKDLERMKEQMEILNIKLDRIVKILTSPMLPKEVKAQKPESEEKSEEVVSKKKEKKEKAAPKKEKEVKIRKSKKA